MLNSDCIKSGSSKFCQQSGLGSAPLRMFLRPSQGIETTGNTEVTGKAELNAKMKKEAQTQQTLNSDPGDLAAFREMAISEGTPQTDETSVTQDPQCQHQRANICVRGGPEAYEPGLPTRAAGCQVFSSALPSCYAR